MQKLYVRTVFAQSCLQYLKHDDKEVYEKWDKGMVEGVFKSRLNRKGGASKIKAERAEFALTKAKATRA